MTCSRGTCSFSSTRRGGARRCCSGNEPANCTPLSKRFEHHHDHPARTSVRRAATACASGATRDMPERRAPPHRGRRPVRSGAAGTHRMDGPRVPGCTARPTAVHGACVGASARRPVKAGGGADRDLNTALLRRGHAEACTLSTQGIPARSSGAVSTTRSSSSWSASSPQRYSRSCGRTPSQRR